jgi:hypothetical protein
MHEHLTEAEIQNYIQEGARNTQVAGHLKECRSCFHTYVSLREALFYMKTGTPATRAEESQVLSLVHAQNRSTIQIVLRFLKDRVLVSSAGQETLDFNGVSAVFNYRGDQLQGPISITRTIGDREVTIVLTPSGGGEHFYVSVSLKKPEPLEVSLLVKGTEIEIIPDVSKQAMFDTNIDARGECTLVFRKDGQEVVNVGLSLENEH